MEPENDVGEEQEIDEDVLNGRAYISISVGLEDGEWMSEKLKQLVELRNELVHHFLSRFGLNSEASCQEAIDFLATVAKHHQGQQGCVTFLPDYCRKAKNRTSTSL